ncbi:MAG: type IV toxin-antitoxin system AbiEi family antitoxin domain-containing protein [Acidobacteria bacterium]|nr:type IV toxin-antitoxin system AbiEi family antitoxin domain-containing protein [Acidobacteriota bacterium]
MERVAALASKAGVLRPRDLQPHRIARHYLRRAEEKGLIRRAARGLYLPAGASLTENHSLAEACKRVPRGVICLLSALRFHDVGTQDPFEVWVAIGNRDRAPKCDAPRMRVVRFSGDSLDFGQECHVVEGVPVRVTSVAKTVADCFKFRNKVGRDVAIEALGDCLRRRKASPGAILEAARVCRVARIMEPYIEALL